MNESDREIENPIVQKPRKSVVIGLMSLLRLLVAISLTGTLGACWLYLFAYRMGIPLQNPLPYFLAALTGIMILVPLLTRNLLESPMRKRVVGGLAVLVFTGVFTGITVTHVAESLPLWFLWGYLLSSAAWIFWLVWFIPLTRGSLWGWGILVSLLFWGWFSTTLIRFDGLTGDARAKFAWAGSPGQSSVSSKPTKESEAGRTAVEIPKPTQLDFPEFLGNRQGQLLARPFLTDWEHSPPKLLWKKPVGVGWSSFALLGDLGVTLEQRDLDECTVCYRLSTGEELWRHSEQTRFEGVLGGDGPRSTPTIDGDRVYVVGGTGLLSCLDLATGEKKWGINLLEDNGGDAIYHGVCGSPLIVGRTIFVSATGGAGISLVAYDKLTGRRYWRSGKWPATYSSPMLAKLKGQEQILVHNNKGIESHDHETGRLLWSYEWTNTEKTVCSQPIVVPGTDNQVFLSIGYGKGSVLLEIDGGEEIDWSAKPLWTSQDMKTKFTTAVIHEGFVYGLDDGILACLDLKTGKRVWKRGRYQHGQLLLVGDWLLIQAEEGDLVLVRPNPEQLEEVGRIPALSSKTWNNPAIGRDHLVVRNDREAICFRITPESP